MEFPDQGSDPSCSCKLSHSCGNARSLTHCARPRIKPKSQCSQDASHLVANLDPQVSSVLAQVDQALVQMRGVLSGIKNIGFIRKGVEDHAGANTSTIQLRSTEF